MPMCVLTPLTQLCNQVLDCPTRKMGHAFVLAALLTRPDNLPWGNNDPELAYALIARPLSLMGAYTGRR
jgi:hypothetical protein